MSVLSGRGPASAVRAVVIDDRLDEHIVAVDGGGYTLELADEPANEPLVRFEDAGGALVPVPLPDGKRAQVPDAPEPCPVCSRCAWVVVADEVCCDACGYRVGRLWSADPELAAMTSMAAGPSAFSVIIELAPLTVPAYAVPDLGSDISRGEERERVTVTHDVPGRLQVTSAASVEGDLRTVLEERLDVFPDVENRSEAGQMIGIELADRATRAAVLRAPEEVHAFAVDGVPVPFTMLRSGEIWVARRQHEGVHITIVAERFPARHVTLGRLVVPDDPRAGNTAAGAAAPPLSRTEVDDLIADCDLDAFREPILAAIRPAYRIQEAADGPHRLGGLPDLAPGEQWPYDERGVPHTFVAQIDCSQLPPLSREFRSLPWRHDGALLRIFAALSARYDEFESVVLACPPDTELVRAAELPPHPDEVEDWDVDDQGEFLRKFEERPAQLNPTLTAMVAYTADVTDADDEDYWTFQTRLFLGGRPLGEDEGYDQMQLLGHAATTQGEDPRTYADFPDGDPDDWAVLLSFHDTPDLSHLSIVIPVEDLAAGRYHRLVVDAQLF